jgi:hypothetical protein
MAEAIKSNEWNSISKSAYRTKQMRLILVAYVFRYTRSEYYRNSSQSNSRVEHQTIIGIVVVVVWNYVHR